MAKSPKLLAAKAAKPPSVSELASYAEPSAAQVLTVGGLSFVITGGHSLPDGWEGQRATKIPPLPFDQVFSQMPVGGHFFLPDEFWTERQKAGHILAKTKLTTTYIKGKIRAVFDKWVAEKDHTVERGPLRLVMFARPNGISPQDDPSFPTDPRPGVSVYITNKDK